MSEEEPKRPTLDERLEALTANLELLTADVRQMQLENRAREKAERRHLKILAAQLLAWAGTDDEAQEPGR